MMRELDALGDRLGLTFEQIVDSTNDVMLKKARPLLEEARDTLMLSPEKGKAFKDLYDTYNLSIPFENDYYLIAPYRALWDMEYTGTFEMYDCPVDIRLKKGEICRHKTSCNWMQLKLKRNHVVYAVEVLSLKFQKISRSG